MRAGAEAVLRAAPLRERAPGKVNLCLFLGPVREDGRHQLVTLFESVSLYDELVVTPAELDEVVCAGVDGPNLVADALAGLRAAGWEGPQLRVEIAKGIPVAGGMGGGSADAAAILRIAPRLAPVSRAVLAELAASLGADVPAQLTPGLVLGTGAGELVSPQPPLAPHALLILPLAQRLATAEVYAAADRLGLQRGTGDLEARRRQLDAELRDGARLPPRLVSNDLEPATISLCPAVGQGLRAVRNAGADHALVCGSGPTVAGLFWGQAGGERAAVAAATLAPTWPGAATVAPVSSRA